MCGNQCIKIEDVCQNTSNIVRCADAFHRHCKQTNDRNLVSTFTDMIEFSSNDFSMIANVSMLTIVVLQWRMNVMIMKVVIEFVKPRFAKVCLTLRSTSENESFILLANSIANRIRKTSSFAWIVLAVAILAILIIAIIIITIRYRRRTKNLTNTATASRTLKKNIEARALEMFSFQAHQMLLKQTMFHRMKLVNDY